MTTGRTASVTAQRDPATSGLEGIVAARTELSDVDGLKGVLTIRGYDIEEIAGQITEPRADLGIAANLLFQMPGEEPDAAKVKGLETYLVTVTDHGMNASTFTARVIASTDSDMISAVAGAIGALKGPLHGGAPGPALTMIEEIGTADRAEAWMKDAITSGKRLMGFGHRVYKVRDPRAEVLYKAAALLAQETGSTDALELAHEV